MLFKIDKKLRIFEDYFADFCKSEEPKLETIEDKLFVTPTPD